MLREVGATEYRIIGEHHLEGPVRLPLGAPILDAESQHVTPLGLVVAEEVEVIAGDVDPLDVGRAAEADEGTGDVGVFEDGLALRHFGERPVGRMLARDTPQLHDRKRPVNPDRPEEVG